ncbi:MAG: DUF4369 domain-containing protein [Flavobacteriaceae bacterium]|nr:DUF4369 domain-containing protein [Flavobacteriaceae bacterium]
MTKNILLAAIITLIVFSCTPDKKEGSMVVEGNIQGMKKGMLYLQKVEEGLLVSVDSTFLNGISNYRLVDNIEGPELYYLTLDQLKYGKIDFFGEEGYITINTKLEKFETAAEISGSESNELLEEYFDMAKQFDGRQLEIFKENFDAQKANDIERTEELAAESKRLTKNKIRYTASFTMRNPDSEVAPFIVLTELSDAHITLLDTLNNSLSKSIKDSKYGVALDTYIKGIKESDIELN